MAQTFVVLPEEIGVQGCTEDGRSAYGFDGQSPIGFVYRNGRGVLRTPPDSLDDRAILSGITNDRRVAGWQVRFDAAAGYPVTSPFTWDLGNPQGNVRFLGDLGDGSSAAIYCCSVDGDTFFGAASSAADAGSYREWPVHWNRDVADAPCRRLELPFAPTAGRYQICDRKGEVAFAFAAESLRDPFRVINHYYRVDHSGEGAPVLQEIKLPAGYASMEFVACSEGGREAAVRLYRDFGGFEDFLWDGKLRRVRFENDARGDAQLHGCTDNGIVFGSCIDRQGRLTAFFWDGEETAHLCKPPKGYEQSEFLVASGDGSTFAGRCSDRIGPKALGTAAILRRGSPMRTVDSIIDPLLSPADAEIELINVRCLSRDGRTMYLDAFRPKNGKYATVYLEMPRPRRIAADRPFAESAYAALDVARQAGVTAEAGPVADARDAASSRAADNAAAAVDVEADMIDEPERLEEYLELQTEAYRSAVIAEAFAMQEASSGTATDEANVLLATYARVCLERDLLMP
jgi:hypothetical protein